MFSTALLPIPWSNLFSTASSSAIRANPSRRRARSSKPRLPAELESMVLDTFHDLRNPKDLTWLWVGGRHVSKHFRSDIERIFRTVLLPETILRCDLGNTLRCGPQILMHHAGIGRDSTDRYTGLQLRSWDVFKTWGESYGVFDQMSTFIWPGVSCFILDRFSDDQTKAFLKCEEYTNRASKDVVFRRLHEKQLVGAPLFSIQVREVVNDTGLPELQIDDQKEEISFNWKGMLDQLLGEEHVFNTILAQRLGWHLDPGKDTPSLLGTHRKLARRSRLQRECRAKYGSNILERTYFSGLLFPVW